MQSSVNLVRNLGLASLVCCLRAILLCVEWAGKRRLWPTLLISGLTLGSITRHGIGQYCLDHLFDQRTAHLP